MRLRDIDGDCRASLEVYSSEDGVDFLASADAPSGSFIVRTSFVAGRSRLHQAQSFRKLTENATDSGLATAAVTTQGDGARDIAVQSDGKIVIAGAAGRVNPNFGVVRFDPHGALDPTFASKGSLDIDFFGFADAAESVIIQPDGRIVLGGLARMRSTATASRACCRSRALRRWPSAGWCTCSGSV